MTELQPASMLATTDGPLAEEVRKTLYDEILAGTLPPGTRLDEVSLAERFGVSRTPIREALREMVSTGLAEHHHRRGVFVARVPAAQLDEMFEFAAELEATCARLAASNMTLTERDALMALHLDSHRHITDGDVNAYDSANMAFHGALFAGAHNRYLQEATRQARRRVAPFRRAQFLVGDRLASSFEEHSRIVLAVMRGHGDDAAELVRAHIQRSRELSREYLDQGASE